MHACYVTVCYVSECVLVYMLCELHVSMLVCALCTVCGLVCSAVVCVCGGGGLLTLPCLQSPNWFTQERTSEESKEATSFKGLLHARTQEFVDEVCSKYLIMTNLDFG